MTGTDHLGLPFIEGGQAQKHVTHNEALRILDAAIQIAVLDRTRTTPPASPVAGQRHIVAVGAGGAWAGQGDAIATWQDGAWAYLAPNTGWCVWSVADDAMLVFDGAHWRDLRNLALDNATRLGVNTAASAPNLLSVKSNAALFAAIAAADAGSGDVRIQLSKESAGKTASVYFSDNYSGRAEFGLVGSDAFKLKVSADGSGWTEALAIDQASGNLALPRGLSLAGVIAPAQITSNQNDYNPAGLASASVLQIASDAARSVSGLAGGAEGRIVALINIGSQPVTLLDDNTASVSSNRFLLGGGLILTAKQAAILRYDGTAARWQAIAARGNAGVTPPQGRLTLQSGVPVMTTSQAARTTVYYTPYLGNQVPIYDGAGMAAIMFGELSASTTDTSKSPAAIGASKINDWFVWNDAGTLRLSHGPDWSSATARSAGTALAMTCGILLNAMAIANGPAALRGSYVGTTLSDASGALNWIAGGSAAGGSAGVFAVWNAYNRKPFASTIRDSTVSWTYAGGFRPANNSAAMRVTLVQGLSEDTVTARYVMFHTNGPSSAGHAGIGFDLTTSNAGSGGEIPASASGNVTASASTVFGIGAHFVAAIEHATNAVTFYGSNGSAELYGSCLQVEGWA